MDDKDKVVLTLSYPKWSLVLLPLMLVGGLLIVAFIVGFYLMRDGLTWPIVWGSLFCLCIFSGWLWLIPFFYSTIIATGSGLHTTGPFRQNQHMTWEEISSVAMPRLGIPREFTYVFSNSGKKIVLLKSTESYLELLDLIQSKAINLTTGKLPPEAWPRHSSWIKTWLVLAGFFAIYLAAKRYFGF